MSFCVWCGVRRRVGTFAMSLGAILRAPAAHPVIRSLGLDPAP